MPRIVRHKELGLSQLRAFRECVRQKSFSAAARALGLSQPAVWQQVRALERALGVSLFQRHGREWAPTEDGRILLDQAAPLLGAADSLREAFRERQAESPRSLLVIGTPGVVAEDLARPAADYIRKHPNVRLSLVNHSGPRTLDLLLAGDADLAILPAGTDIVAHRQFLTAEPISSRNWVLAMPAEHPLTRKRKIALADVTRFPLILPEAGSGWRRQLEDAFRSAGVLERVQTALEASMTLAVRRFVALGVGLALLPLPAEAINLPGVVVRPIDDFLPPEQVVALWRRGSPLRPHVRTAVDFVEGAARPEVNLG